MKDIVLYFEEIMKGATALVAMFTYCIYAEQVRRSINEKYFYIKILSLAMLCAYTVHFIYN